MSELALGREPVLADAVAGRLIELAGVECSRRNRSGCFALMDDRCPSTDEEQSVHLDLAYADARTGLDRRPARIEHWLDALSVRPAAWLLRRTGGRAARLWRRRALVLTTRGRRTGRARSVPLQYSERDEPPDRARAARPDHRSPRRALTIRDVLGNPTIARSASRSSGRRLEHKLGSTGSDGRSSPGSVAGDLTRRRWSRDTGICWQRGSGRCQGVTRPRSVARSSSWLRTRRRVVKRSRCRRVGAAREEPRRRPVTIARVAEVATDTQQLPLIWSKLETPVARARVARPQLVERLCGASRKLTLVRAPAGWGKSTLLAEWQSVEAEQRPFAWLALDTQDNDPVRFWTYVVEALRTALPELGESSRVLTQTPGLDLTEDMLPVLINELGAAPGDAVLVLDDYHLITHERIHDGLRFLLQHLPRSLELVVSTRVEPPFQLPRLRANGELVEIDAAALSFSADEADAMLNGVHGLEIDRAAVASLRRRTEGWAAGLYLAALSLRGRDDADEFVEAFAGDERSVVDYLSEEVLAAQPEEMRVFLRRTSILERLSASLCDAVTGTSLSASMLETITRSNFFLLALDTKREWYRYHHLFGELLRYELDAAEPELVPELHRRAARWLLAAGFPSEAIHHSLAAGDEDAAAELILEHWLAFRDRHRQETVLAWLDGLPAERVASDPRLCLVEGSTLLELFRIDEAAGPLDAAELGAPSLPTAAERARVSSGVVACRSIVDYLVGDVAGIRDTVRPALDGGEPGDAYWGSVLLTLLGASLLFGGRSGDAAETLERAVRLGAESRHALAWIHAPVRKAAVHGELGDWNRAADAVAELDALVAGQPSLREYYGTQLGHVVRGRLLARDGREAEADAAMARCTAFPGRTGSLVQAAYGALAHAELKHALGERESAAALLRAAALHIGACVDPGTLPARLAKLEALVFRSGDTAGLGVAALSDRELQVARLVVARKTNPEIAAELFVSVKTVETHMRHIFRKLGVSSRVEVARAIEDADRRP
jgi:ATP/maltotriose-dependent transcriptional regulator MalT